MPMTRSLAVLAAAAALSGCAAFGGGPKGPERKAPEEGRISILSFEQKLEVEPALAGRQPAVAPALALTEWSQPGGLATNAPQHVAGDGAFQVLWRREVVAGSSDRVRLSATPVVAGGRIYLLGADQEVNAIDEATGRSLWRVQLRPREGRDRVAFGGGVALGDGRLIVTSGFGFTAALDPSTGRELWRATVGAPFNAAPTAVGGRVYATSNDSELVALDAATGAVLWTHQAIAEPARILSASSPAVVADTVIAPFPSGEVVALLAANGRRLWVDALSRAGRLTSLSAINDIAGRPAVADGVIYAASHSGILAAIDQRSGQRVWARGLASTQTPWPSGDSLFVVSVDGELAAMERSTGQVFWVTQLRRYKDQDDRKGRVSWAGPVLVGGKLLLASSLGEVAIVAPETGAVERTLSIGGPVFVAPVVANGVVYLLTDEGRLVALK